MVREKFEQMLAIDLPAMEIGTTEVHLSYDLTSTVGGLRRLMPRCDAVQKRLIPDDDRSPMVWYNQAHSARIGF